MSSKRRRYTGQDGGGTSCLLWVAVAILALIILGLVAVVAYRLGASGVSDITTTEPTPVTSGAGVTGVVDGMIPARVVRVVDGDTIVVAINGSEYTVRYIGVDTPETKAPNTPVQPYGPEAAEENARLVEGKTVYLEKDVSETDRYGRLLRYVWVDGVMVNEELVRRGYARVSTFPPDVKHAERFLELEREAREANRGLWSLEEAATAMPTATAIASPAAALCPGGCATPPAGCLIKGNISGDGSRVYHLPVSPYYERTVINAEDGERWFCTEEEAQAAGWRPPGG